MSKQVNAKWPQQNSCETHDQGFPKPVRQVIAVQDTVVLILVLPKYYFYFSTFKIVTCPMYKFLSTMAFLTHLYFNLVLC